jgi:hypothetical protein
MNTERNSIDEASNGEQNQFIGPLPANTIGPDIHVTRRFIGSQVTPVFFVCCGLFIAMMLLVFTFSAYAQGTGPGFHASANGSFGSCPWTGGIASSLTDPVSVGPFTNPCAGGTSGAAARAGAGILGAYADATHPCCGSGTGAVGSARFRVENLVFTGPAGPNIPVSLNIHLKGTLTSNTDFDGGFLSLQVTLAGFNTNAFSKSEIQTSRPNVPVHSGVFDPLAVTFPTFTIDQDFVIPLGMAAPNTPLLFEISFSVSSDSVGNPGFSQFDFFTGSNGISLAVGPSVFNLPDGYTVNNNELNIMDNRFGVSPPPEISVDPLNVNFGSVALGTQSSTVITISNTGGPGLRVNEASLSGSAGFSIGAIRKGGMVVNLPVDLAGSETADIDLLFSPPGVGVFAGLLTIRSNDSDEDLLEVPLAGQGVQVQSPPEQQIASILAFFDSSTQIGTLVGNGPGNSAAGRLKALRNMIEAAGDLVAAGNLAEACGQLKDVLDRIDGNPNPPDFAGGSALLELRTRVTALRETLGCP